MEQEQVTDSADPRLRFVLMQVRRVNLSCGAMQQPFHVEEGCLVWPWLGNVSLLIEGSVG